MVEEHPPRHLSVQQPAGASRPSPPSVLCRPELAKRREPPAEIGGPDKQESPGQQERFAEDEASPAGMSGEETAHSDDHQGQRPPGE
jgi:hypothetical protein